MTTLDTLITLITLTTLPQWPCDHKAGPKQKRGKEGERPQDPGRSPNVFPCGKAEKVAALGKKGSYDPRFGTNGVHTGHLFTGHTGPGGPWPYWPYWSYWPLEWPPAGTQQGRRRRTSKDDPRKSVSRSKGTETRQSTRTEPKPRNGQARRELGGSLTPRRTGRLPTSNSGGARPQPPERENDVEQARQPTVTESGLDTCSKGTGEPEPEDRYDPDRNARRATPRRSTTRGAGTGDRMGDGAKRDAAWGPRTSGQSQQVASSGQPMRATRATRNAARSECTRRRPRGRRGRVWETKRDEPPAINASPRARRRAPAPDREESGPGPRGRRRPEERQVRRSSEGTRERTGLQARGGRQSRSRSRRRTRSTARCSTPDGGTE